MAHPKPETETKVHSEVKVYTSTDLLTIATLVQQGYAGRTIYAI